MTPQQIELINKIHKGLAAKTQIFSHDLLKAQQVENELVELLKTKYDWKSIITSQDKGSCPGWDIKLELNDGSIILFESKSDYKAPMTGNVAVELFRSIDSYGSRQTCLMASISNYFVYKILDKFYCIETSLLRQMFEEKKYVRIQNNCGDGKRSTCALFEFKKFSKECEVIK